MIDVVLAFPLPSKESPFKTPALGIFYVGAKLEACGYNVEYYDERFDPPIRLNHLLRKRPLFFGVSAMTGYQLAGAKKMLELAKKVSSLTHTVLGGVHASLLPQECVMSPEVDFVVVGEGEQTMLQLVSQQKNFVDIDGLWWMQEDNVAQHSGRHREFMDPAQWMFPMTDKSQRYYQIAVEHGELMYQTTRGCSHNCGFCYNNVFNRRKYRMAPLDKVEGELSMLKLKLGDFDSINICDDNVGINKERLIDLASILREFKLKWITSIRATAAMDPELLKHLEGCGCYQLQVGVESGSDKILQEVIHKGYVVEQIRECVGAIARTNITGRYNFVYGLPGDNKETLKQSIVLADWIIEKDGKSFVVFDAYIAYPGTDLYHLYQPVNKRPRGLLDWSEMGLSGSDNKVANVLYYISGLKTRGGKGGLTERNFPGRKRLLIWPFEVMAQLRWKLRFFHFFGFEKWAIQRLFSWAVRNENRRSKQKLVDY